MEISLIKNDSNVILIVGKGLETTEKHKNTSYNHSDFEFVLQKEKKSSITT